MRFMFFGPEVCLGLPSDSASPRTPLPPTTATAAFTAQDLHLVDNAHAGHTKAARMTAVTASPGTASVSIGISAPPMQALFAASLAMTPSTAPSPNGRLGFFTLFRAES